MVLESELRDSCVARDRLLNHCLALSSAVEWGREMSRAQNSYEE